MFAFLLCSVNGFQGRLEHLYIIDVLRSFAFSPHYAVIPWYISIGKTTVSSWQNLLSSRGREIWFFTPRVLGLVLMNFVFAPELTIAGLLDVRVLIG